MPSIVVYTYDQDNIFVGTATAYEDRFAEGTYLLPANSTTSPPPAINDHEVPVWNGVAWAVHNDNRGTWWDVDTQQITEVIIIDVLPPVNSTDVAPPPEEPTWNFTGAIWERDLAAAKEEKTGEILAAYTAAREAVVPWDGKDYDQDPLTVEYILLAVAVGPPMADMYDAYHDTFQLNIPALEDVRDAIYAVAVISIINREVKLLEIDNAGDIPTTDAISW